MSLYNVLRTITDNGMYWNLQRQKRITGLFDLQKLIKNIEKLNTDDFKYNFLKYYITTDTREHNDDNYAKQFIRNEWMIFMDILKNNQISKLYETSITSNEFDLSWSKLEIEHKLNVLYSVARFINYNEIESMLDEAFEKIDDDDLEKINEFLTFYKNICKYFESNRGE